MIKLEVKSLSKSFGTTTVVSKTSFYVSKGEVVGLLGPNGAGKTTSFYMVVGLLRPDNGSILLGGKDITHYPMHKRAKSGISYLPQNSSIFKKLTVEQNLMAIMELVNYPKPKRKDRLNELLQRFQISHIQKSLGTALSGGERRRVEIARSLIVEPDFLLLDEPFAGVDPITVHEIQQLILDLKSEGIGVLITDHNVRETLGSCDRSYILSKGKIIAKGSAREVIENEKVRKTYLGESFKYD